MNDIIVLVRGELKAHSDEKTRVAGLRFFKEEIKSWGVSSSDVEKISKAVFKESKGRPEWSKSSIFSLCEELLRSGFIEESFVACHWSYYMRMEFLEDDIKVFRKWIDNYVGNWASCDTLCNHTVGSFVEMYPSGLTDLKLWAVSPNRWMRRASAVSLIIPARKGLFFSDVLEIADILLTDSDEMVQKGYGWMLKAASKPFQREVFDYVMKNKAVMPRTALRYALEKMPPEMKKRAMAK
ncbi:MAG: DNA alkylation repair protein [Brevinematales bacterium]|jgi:3-methyladenine DNA glycosylase AlkD